MRCNPWLVALLGAMPLFILVAGLAAAAGGLASPVVWVLLGMVVAAGVLAAWMAVRTAER